MWALKGISIGLAAVILELLIFIGVKLVKFWYLVTIGKQTYMTTTVLPVGEYWFWIAFATTVAFASWYFKTRAA